MRKLRLYLEQQVTAAELRLVARRVEGGIYTPEELVAIFLQDERSLKLKAIRVLDEWASP